MLRLLIIFALMLSGVALLVAAQVRRDTPPRIEAMGHPVRYRVEGEARPGVPTVVFEIGLGGPLEEWAAVQPAVAKFTRTFSYDRIGSNHTLGVPLTGNQIAREVHAALVAAHIPPPYVLVGQSFAGVYNRLFASMYPGEVVGLVLLDASQEEFITWLEAFDPNENYTKMSQPGWPEGMGIGPTLDELKVSGPLPVVPIVVVTAARPTNEPKKQLIRQHWIDAHEAWVKTQPRARHVITEESGHGVHVEQPELVVREIRAVVDEASLSRDATRSAGDH